MKKALLKDSFKQIKKTYKRFISILLMAFLGVGFFAGVRATSPDMALTIDNYFDKHNVYDIQIVSTLGLTKDDLIEISKINGVENAIGIYSEDVLVKFEDEESVIKIIGLEEDINQVELLEGNLPQNIDECVIENSMKNAKGVSVGDYIQITEDLDEDEDASFKNSKLKVVGVVQSPLYISRDRGTTALGSGKIAYYMFINKENIESDIYTEIAVVVNDAKALSTISEEYDDKTEKVKDSIENIKLERQTARYNELIQEATEKLDDAQKEFDEEKADAEKKIADAEKEIADGKKELTEAKKELQEGKDKAHIEFTDAESKLAEAETQIILGQEQLDKNKIEFENQKKEAQAGITQLEEGISLLNDQIVSLNENKTLAESVLSALSNIDTQLISLQTMLDSYKEQYESATGDTTELLGMIEYLEKQIDYLNSEKVKLEAYEISKETLNTINSSIAYCENEKNGLENQLNTIQSQLVYGEQSLYSAQLQLNNGWNQVQAGKNELNEKRNEINQEFQDAEKEIAKAERELADGEKELEENKKEFEIEIADAEAKLIDAREKINDIEEAKWYILDRYGNSGFDGFATDTENIERLGEAFPIVFFVIATLISLTSMSRMVEEERVQIGTLKALGYNKLQIMSKYIIYSLLASVIGGILGAIFGLYFFPTVIISMYQMMYDIKELVIELNKIYMFSGIGIMTICIVGATIFTAMKELKSTPAEMMRPKAPRAGKRVLLEKIPFIWSKLDFTQKVTLRNMFRYKKRFLMTVVGICGCTALVLVGFGLLDSISKIMDYQYIDIYDYDMMIGLKNTLTEDEISSLKSDLENKEQIKKCVEVYMSADTAQNGELKEDTQIIVTKDPEDLKQVIKLKDLKTGEELKLNDEEVIITDKLAQLIEADIGDEIVLCDSDNNEHIVKVGGITEHYISHYVYMTDVLYNKVSEEEFSSNVLYTQYGTSLTEEAESELSKEILLNSKVGSVTLTTTLMKTMDDTLSAMNFVVYVLIASAALLAFIVLYNLSNVNISERIRELATIKVLGFYDKEVYNYVTREIVLLTVIGILCGLVFGNVLNSFILGTCEIGMLRFKRIILIPSYIYSTVITIIFTYIVNLITYFSLKKVDMIEALKSVE